jgi:O-acetyl-ADP-ribose deacetylase (regulator of RNase III)
MFVKYMKPVLRVVLVDVNTKVVSAWQKAFHDTPEVEIVRGSILTQEVDAWVTPTNARGEMNGGVDAIIRRHLGDQIQHKVRAEIKAQYGGAMPIGAATCVLTGLSKPAYLISTPTMLHEVENVSQTMNVALACAAAFQAIHMQNTRQADSIQSVAIPGLGTGTGQVPPRVCANLMWTAYTLFNDCEFQDFAELRATLLAQLGDLSGLKEEDRLRVEVG